MNPLLAQHVTLVYRFALRLTGGADAAEELTQETIVRAWRHQARLRDPEAARTWLLRIAANTWRDTLRRRRIRAATALHDDLATGPAPRERCQDAGEADEALAALDALPDRQRDVMYLHACCDLTNGQIAEVLGISAGAVKASLSVARQRLRDALPDLAQKETAP